MFRDLTAWIFFLVVFFGPVMQPSSADQFNSARGLYDNAVRSTVLIVNQRSEASGVLIDKRLKLVATNAHVTNGSDRVDVFFAAFRNGEVVGDRNFYTKSNLRRTDFYTSARVIAEDVGNDVAIISLDSVPGGTVDYGEIVSCDKMSVGDPVHIIGRSELGLWRWMAGHFRGCEGNLVHTDAVTLPGNSGSPVFTDRGLLLGIHSRSERHIGSTEIHASLIYDLFRSLETARVFSIENRTRFEINYRIKRNRKSEDWFSRTLKSGGIYTHWYYGDGVSPQVSFDYLMGEAVKYKTYDLETYSRRVSPDDAKRRLTRKLDAREYHFSYYSEKHEIDLHDSEDK